VRLVAGIPERTFARYMYRQLMYLSNAVAENKRNREWYLRNKKRMRPVRRAWHVRNHYGLSDENALLRKQGGVCAICGTRRSRKAVDHDHLTKRVRGVLCQKCNSGIGMFEDNINWLRKAIKYIKEAA
jgi:hypothetical protein